LIKDKIHRCPNCGIILGKHEGGIEDKTSLTMIILISLVISVGVIVAMVFLNMNTN